MRSRAALVLSAACRVASVPPPPPLLPPSSPPPPPSPPEPPAPPGGTVTPTVVFETAMKGFGSSFDTGGWKSAWANFVNRDEDDIVVSLTNMDSGQSGVNPTTGLLEYNMNPSYTVVTTIISVSASQASAIQRLISHAVDTDTLATELKPLFYAGGPDFTSATFLEPTIGAIVIFSPPPPPTPAPPPPSEPLRLPPPSCPAFAPSSAPLAIDQGGSERLPIGAILGAVAGAVVLSVVTGVLVYRRMRRSKQPRATLASPVPVEMMPSATSSAKTDDRT